MGLTLQHHHSRNTSLRRQAGGDQAHHQNCIRDAVGQIKLRLSSKSSLLESVTSVGRVPAGVSWLPSLPQHSPVFLCVGPEGLWEKREHWAGRTPRGATVSRAHSRPGNWSCQHRSEHPELPESGLEVVRLEHALRFIVQAVSLLFLGDSGPLGVTGGTLLGEPRGGPEGWRAGRLSDRALPTFPMSLPFCVPHSPLSCHRLSPDPHTPNLLLLWSFDPCSPLGLEKSPRSSRLLLTL